MTPTRFPGLVRRRFPYDFAPAMVRIPTRITAADILACVAVTSEADVFAFTRALVTRNADAALAAMARLAKTDSPERLIKLVEWQIRKALTDHGRSDGAVILAQLARAERQMHSHRAGHQLIFERLVLDILRS